MCLTTSQINDLMLIPEDAERVVQLTKRFIKKKKIAKSELWNKM